MRQHAEQFIAQCRDARADGSLQLPLRRAQRHVRLRGDHIHHRLRLGQIEFSIQPCALRELARLRMTCARPQQRLQHPPRHQHAAVTGNLHRILAGETGRPFEIRRQHRVHHLPVIHDASQHRTPRRQFSAAPDIEKNLPRPAPAHAEQGDGSSARRRGHGGDGVLACHDRSLSHSRSTRTNFSFCGIVPTDTRTYSGSL